MKIVDRKAFLALPGEALFSEFQPCVFDELLIKTGNYGANDFGFDVLIGAIKAANGDDEMNKLMEAAETGASLAMDFHVTHRDGLFDDDQLYAVYERADVEALIARLQLVLERSAP